MIVAMAYLEDLRGRLSVSYLEYLRGRVAAGSTADVETKRRCVARRVLGEDVEDV